MNFTGTNEEAIPLVMLNHENDSSQKNPTRKQSTGISSSSNISCVPSSNISCVPSSNISCVPSSNISCVPSSSQPHKLVELGNSCASGTVTLGSINVTVTSNQATEANELSNQRNGMQLGLGKLVSVGFQH